MAFKNLEKARASGTATFTFDFIDLGAGPPVLEVRYGGKGTPGFRADAIKVANKQRGDRLTERVLDEGLVDTAKLLAKHCVVSWKNVVEDDGTPAPCTPAKVEEFLLGLIEHADDLFTDFSVFVRTRENFVDAPTSSGGGAALGKP